jgi:hypothetical protein
LFTRVAEDASHIIKQGGSISLCAFNGVRQNVITTAGARGES